MVSQVQDRTGFRKFALSKSYIFNPLAQQLPHKKHTAGQVILTETSIPFASGEYKNKHSLISPEASKYRCRIKNPNQQAYVNNNSMTTTTFLTFVGDQCGKGEEAINFYTATFPNSEIKSITKYAAGEAGGTPALIKYGVFTLNGTEYMISESNYKHAWSFSPGVSIFVSDNSDDLITDLFEKLSSNGSQIMVPLDDYNGEGDYGFGKKFGWCADKYGISWQFVVTA